MLGRTLTKPQMAINRGVTDTLVKRLTTAARQKRTVEENAMLKEFADEQWDSTGNAARRTAIGKFFQGQTLQLKKCQHCGEYSPCTADPFLIEQLHLKPLAERPRGSLEELLEAASAPELPTDYRCDGCRKLGTTAIMTGLVRLPRVFVVRLNRTHRTPVGAESRISTPIDYPDQLNLAETGAFVSLRNPSLLLFATLACAWLITPYHGCGSGVFVLLQYAQGGCCGHPRKRRAITTAIHAALPTVSSVSSSIEAPRLSTVATTSQPSVPQLAAATAVVGQIDRTAVTAAAGVGG